MDFAHSDEQLMLRTSARDWLARSYPPETVIALADDLAGPGSDPDIWSRLEQLGWFEAAAAGMVETGVLLEQTAYALLPAPFFVTVGLAGALGADTSVPTTLAWAEPGAVFVGDVGTTRVDDEGRLQGAKMLVPDLGSVRRAVVTTLAGPRMITVSDATVVARSSIDRTRRLGDLLLDDVASTPLPQVDLDVARTKMLAACASEAVGVAQKMLDLTVAHAGLREQFGRVIGTYQAVSHQVADVYVALELARSLTTWACWAIDAEDEAAVTAAAAAKADATTAAVRACEVAIQVHGGQGFTWDSMLHRYYKRAQWLESFGGSAAAQRAVVAGRLLDA